MEYWHKFRCVYYIATTTYAGFRNPGFYPLGQSRAHALVTKYRWPMRYEAGHVSHFV